MGFFFFFCFFSLGISGRTVDVSHMQTPGVYDDDDDDDDDNYEWEEKRRVLRENVDD